MLIFIDDSGDPGFKIGQGSSECLVICLVCFDNEADATRTQEAIGALKQRLGYKASQEFKFAKTRADYRQSFAEAVCNLPFKIRAVVFKKERLYSHNLRNNKERFYSFAIRMGL